MRRERSGRARGRSPHPDLGRRGKLPAGGHAAVNALHRTGCRLAIPPTRLALLVLLAASWSAAVQAGVGDRVDEFVQAELKRQKIPGVAVAVVKGGRVIVAKGYGLADLEHEVPVTAETIFQSGSVGKQFTAAAVMLQVEGEKIALDERVTRWFPEAPDTWRPITVRHLLTHTSGIPDYTPETLDLRRDYSEDELARFAFGLKLEFDAGSRWSYSNTGYVLLGIIVHRASGRFYGDVLRERVFAPLGMRTARIISEEEIVPHRAAGYRLVGEELKNQEWVAPRLNTTADGSLYFSILDLIAWERGLRSGAILKPGSWAQIFEPVRLNSGRSYPYGFGWSVDEVAGQRRLHHGGAWQGFKAHISRYLGDELTVVVLANLAQADERRLADGIAGIVNPALAQPEPMPIPDREPAVTARLLGLLGAAAEGKLVPEEFAYVRAGFFPEAANQYQALLGGLGAARRADLVERRELGDDRVYAYEVGYADRVVLVRMGLAPDDRLSLFVVHPK